MGLPELDNAIALQVFGRDPFAARLDTATTAPRWITPLAPFADLPELRARRALAADEATPGCSPRPDVMV